MASPPRWPGNMTFFAARYFVPSAIAVSSVVGCTRDNAGDAALLDAQGREAAELALGDLDKRVSNDFVRGLESRIGCRAAAQFVAQPRAGELQKSAINVVTSPASTTDASRRSVYRRAHLEFWDTKAAMADCADAAGPAASPSDPDAGFRSLIASVRQRGEAAGRSVGLTFVAVGGLGSYMATRGPLEDHVKRWRALAQEPELQGKLRIWQHVCSQYESNAEFCTPELIRRLAELESTDPAQGEHLYVFWGYSNGGNTVFEALVGNEALQRQTLAVVTIGTPFGGSVVANDAKAIAGWVRETRERDPARFGLARQMFSERLASIGDGGALAALVNAPEQFERAYTELLPGKRASRLGELTRLARFSGPFGEPIRFLHVAGVLDMAALPGLPVLTSQQGKIVMKSGSMHGRQVAQVAVLPLFGRYPLSDSIVALQHAAIPESMRPEGLSSEMIAVLNLDHSSLNLTADETGRDLGIPFVAIVDTINAIVARRVSHVSPQ